MIAYGNHNVDETDVDAVVEVLRGEWLTTGPHVQKFEADVAKATGCSDSVAVSSGTAALHAAFAAAGLSRGDEVISPPITFVATQAAAMHLGADPVFVDVRPDTATINPDAVQAAISARTAAIVAVDYAGHPANLLELRGIADKYGLLLIEDAAHSLGSLYHNAPIGNISDITTFSFFPTKNATTGEGGAITARSADVLERARLFSRQGLIRDQERLRIGDEGPWHQEVHELGLNYRLPDILAALGSSQLKRLDEFKRCRSQIKSRYDAAFSSGNLPIGIPHQDLHVEPMWHLYPIRVPAAIRREIFQFLRAAGVQVQVNYIPVYWHPAFQDRGFNRGLCPVAEAFYSEEISLPLHTKLSDAEVDFVIEATIKAVIQAKLN